MLQNRLLAVIQELGEKLEQIPPDWDPHQRLEYLKMSFRTVISGAVGRDRNELRESIKESEENVNEMHDLKTKACLLDNIDGRDNNIQTSRVRNAPWA